MRTKNRIVRLKQLQVEANRIRNRLGIHAPDALLYYTSLDACGDEQVVVEADGFGGATTSIVDGNYPIDFISHHTKKFDSEEAACKAATEIVEWHARPEAILA